MLDTTSSSNVIGNGNNEETSARPSTPEDATAKAVRDVTSSEVSVLPNPLLFVKGKADHVYHVDWHINLVEPIEAKYCLCKGIYPHFFDSCLDKELTSAK